MVLTHLLPHNEYKKLVLFIYSTTVHFPGGSTVINGGLRSLTAFVVVVCYSVVLGA